MPPHVSVIIPCYNEAETIGLLLEALHAQTLPREQFEIVIADGLSTDGTRQILADYVDRHPEAPTRLVDNPKRAIPSALNRAITASQGDIVIRLDAHSVPAADYLDQCLETLAATGAANVGGRWDIRPPTQAWAARSIAAAVSHPLGAGDARYRTGGRPGPVDTVPFGAFPRHWLEKVGGYDEQLETNEDYDLNVRLREAGGVVWFEPSIRSIYFARGDFRSLARQYARYGFWKARMLLRRPGSLRWRQAAAPLLVLSVLALAVLAAWFDVAAWLLALESFIYLMTLLLVAAERAWKARDPGLAIGIPIALAVIHGSWGAGFWGGLLTRLAGGAREARGDAG